MSDLLFLPLQGILVAGLLEDVVAGAHVVVDQLVAEDVDNVAMDRDITLQGIRLEGDTSGAFQQVIFGNGQARMHRGPHRRLTDTPGRGRGTTHQAVAMPRTTASTPLRSYWRRKS